MLNARPEPRDEITSDSPAPPVPLQAQGGNTEECPRRLPGRASLRLVLGGAVALAAIAMTAAGGFRVLDVLLREGGNALPAFAAMLGGAGLLGSFLFWRAREAAPRHARGLGEVSPTTDAFRAFMLALPDAVLILDRSLTIHFANHAAEQLYGYAIGDLAGVDLRHLMPASVRGQNEQGLRSALADGGIGRVVRGLERVARRKDGREAAIEIDAQSYATPDGPMLMAIIRNVTQRQANERALRRSRENLEIAQRVALVGSFEHDLVTNEVEWTGEFLRIWGISDRPEEHSIEYVTTLVHPDDRRLFTEVREGVLAGKVAPRSDFRVIRPDGTERIFHNEYQLEVDEWGKPVRFHGTVQDVTERKQIEIELRRSRENLARAQRIAGIGSFVHDLVTDRAEWSDELYRLYGLLPERGGGSMKLVLPYVHPDDREAFQGDIRDQVAKRIRTSSLDFRIIRPDGEERILHRECDLSFDESGKPVRMFGTIQDITARKQIELELRRSRESLARAQRFASIGSFQRHLGTGAVELSDELYRIHGI
ncbi:MAG: PAS domain S-box protein, partial [Stellaceae bacterium]